MNRNPILACELAPQPQQSAGEVPNFARLNWALCILALSLLGACGGGGNSPYIPPVVPLAPADQLAETCVAPVYGQKQGTVDDEKAWVRSFVDERYLWYRDVPTVDASKYDTAASYFAVLKTPAKNSVGGDLDRFHWSETKEQYDQYTNGISVDYGIDLPSFSNAAPRNYVVYKVEPQSAAGRESAATARDGTATGATEKR